MHSHRVNCLNTKHCGLAHDIENPIELDRMLSRIRLPWRIRSGDATHGKNYTDSTDYEFNFYPEG